MDTKNVIAAISLSAMVIILYSLFFAPEPRQVNKNNNLKTEKIKDNSKSTTPSIKEKPASNKVIREDALKISERIKIENNNIIGSISLKGSAIDDLTFKKYNTKLNSNEKIVLLNPKSSENGYFIESGWSTTNKNIEMPDDTSLWKVIGNNKLTPNNPVKLQWTNQQGIIFTNTYQLDDKYLFKLNQKIENKSDDIVDFYPYAQIIRNKKPNVTNFYILHEGLLGVFDETLIEEDYDDIEDKKFTTKATSGWLGITDKYWITAVVPENNRNFTSEFEFENRFKANFIITDPYESKPEQTISNDIKIFVAAKEVDVIDGYAESEGINKFDLAIDWGWFYFFTKPLFFIIDYFFKITGNFGIAIILITACIRIIFFPLANYSFKSMAKMKILAPEMTRLKELHKEDKTKLQQEMMALYKREGVNPISGCLPILIQIPFFFAIYKMLFVTIEMRHQPFFGWIQDLSERDPTSIFNLFGLIPWDPPSFLLIGVWPILMGVTMYIQQKLNPPPQDPIQKKIFAFFPLFLTVILAPFPSGLVVYWTVNNVLTMAQQWVIIKRTKVKTT
ncbi:MAG: membrane protein insertase YidC [Candidatus Pelagibacterales bacterium]|nr:MAG: membrane protein insertase YidC [Pelagibacterales bacterium]